MLDSIYIGMSGLVGYSKGLRVISNNLTNVNTPGFKGSELQFADLFYQQNGSDPGMPGEPSAQFGTGLNTLSTTIRFKQGDLQQTGNQLDAAVTGQGFFIVKDKDGQTHYTRNGQFQFNQDGFLVTTTDDSHVQALNDSGELTDISVNGIKINPPTPTTMVSFAGNLSDATDPASTNPPPVFTLNNVNVIDNAGKTHSLTLNFTNKGSGDWSVDALDGTTAVGSGAIEFSGGTIVAASSKVLLNYAPAGASPLALTLDFSNVNAFTSVPTSQSPLKVDKQDGIATGDLTNVTFDTDGKLVATYSNGQTTKNTQLALASFDSDLDLKQDGGNTFSFIGTDGRVPHLGHANTLSFGSITAGSVEGSNVDLAEEFSQLIVMQRGYQASSHVVTTANDMIQELFDMKGNK